MVVAYERTSAEYTAMLNHVYCLPLLEAVIKNKTRTDHQQDKYLRSELNVLPTN